MFTPAHPPIPPNAGRTLFIMHLTIIAMLGYIITPLGWSISEKYLVITSMTVLLCLGIYHLAIRPFDPMRLLFGVKPKPAKVIERHNKRLN